MIGIDTISGCVTLPKIIACIETQLDILLRLNRR
jgi:hypothetical protein